MIYEQHKHVQRRQYAARLTAEHVALYAPPTPPVDDAQLLTTLSPSDIHAPPPPSGGRRRHAAFFRVTYFTPYAVARRAPPTPPSPPSPQTSECLRACLPEAPAHFIEPRRAKCCRHDAYGLFIEMLTPSFATMKKLVSTLSAAPACPTPRKSRYCAARGSARMLKRTLSLPRYAADHATRAIKAAAQLLERATKDARASPSLPRTTQTALMAIDALMMRRCLLRCRKRHASSMRRCCHAATARFRLSRLPVILVSRCRLTSITPACL